MVHTAMSNVTFPYWSGDLKANPGTIVTSEVSYYQQRSEEYPSTTLVVLKNGLLLAVDVPFDYFNREFLGGAPTISCMLAAVPQ